MHIENIYKSILFFVFLSLINVTGHSNIASAHSQWIKTEKGAVRILVSEEPINKNLFLMGLHFKMLEGWKIYWRSPGDAGYPPSVDWSSSINAQPGPFKWPIPSRFSVLGIETIGYEKEVVLPFYVTVPKLSSPSQLHGKLSYLTCNDICIPIESELHLSLPIGITPKSHFPNLINHFLAKVPGTHDLEKNFLSANASFLEKKPALEINLDIKIPSNSLDAFVETSHALTFGKPQIFIDKEKKTTKLLIPVSGLDKLAPARNSIADVPLTITLSGLPSNIEIPITPSENQNPDISPSIWIFLASAFIGGIILNLMPCVLPVLSIKLLSFVKLSKNEIGAVRSHFLITSIGVLSTFLLIATVLVALKFFGMTIGWGIQFQQPWFLIGISVLLTFFLCNVWDFFQFQLPSFASRLNSKISFSDGFVRDFLQGVLATVLSTPCSAPFIGTAIGFALAQGTLEIYLIFFAIGLGLSVPYLSIAILPQAASILPKPGHWTITLRQVLGVPILITIIWLLTLVYATTSTFVTGCTFLFLLSIVFFLYNRKNNFRFSSIKWTAILAFISLIPILYVVSLKEKRWQKVPSNALVSEKINWQNFDPDQIPRLVSTGKTVFVDVTADWCITCLVNKRVAIFDDSVLEKLNSKNNISMQADWTLPSDTITAYLASFNRFGIPFNVVYGPGMPRGVILPELLLPGSIITAIASAQQEEPLIKKPIK
ncbi:MAG: Thiol:disulfide interchange protein DsbD [Alphaproteobacteria bacterium MarineAlpha3_Bin5]|nr:hypothetical protein [Magnetovibrio sp.]PPR78095.1 MAG: Thiol:disulfide interchange protein DsbD [Alphaproteobacteria bacterium MarineAlpha3_Bin5]